MALPDSNSKNKIGLALGSGAALGAAHIGVLRALEESDVPIDFVAGSSIGAMVAAFYAFGMSVDEIEEVALALDWPDVTGITLSKMGLFSNGELGEILDRELGNVRFEDAEVDLAVIATDISNGEKLIIMKGDVSDAVKASTCVPVIFEPVEIDGRLLVDGGLMESVPLSALQKMGADYTIGVDLKANRKYKRPSSILDVINNTLEIGLSHLANVNLNDIDILIQPDLGEFSRTDTENTGIMIERGYQATIEAMKLQENIS